MVLQQSCHQIPFPSPWRRWQVYTSASGTALHKGERTQLTQVAAVRTLVAIPAPFVPRGRRPIEAAAGLPASAPATHAGGLQGGQTSRYRPLPGSYGFGASAPQIAEWAAGNWKTGRLRLRTCGQIDFVLALDFQVPVLGAPATPLGERREQPTAVQVTATTGDR